MPGLGTLVDAPAVARIVHAATGEDPDDMRIAGHGQTSIVWRVDAHGGPYCVIVAIPDEARLVTARAFLNETLPVATRRQA